MIFFSTKALFRICSNFDLMRKRSKKPQNSSLKLHKVLSLTRGRVKLRPTGFAVIWLFLLFWLWRQRLTMLLLDAGPRPTWVNNCFHFICLVVGLFYFLCHVLGCYPYIMGYYINYRVFHSWVFLNRFFFRVGSNLQFNIEDILLFKISCSYL